MRLNRAGDEEYGSCGRMENQTLSVALAFLLLTHAACTRNQFKKTSPLKERTSLALLPLDNHAINLDAPDKVRTELYQAMKADGWRLIPLESVDSALDRMSISDPGQLSAVPIPSIHRELKADVLIYGSLLEYSLASVGVLTKRTVEIELRAVDPLSGKTLWTAVESGVNTQAGADAAVSLGMGLAGKVASGVKEGIKKIIPRKTPASEHIKKAADVVDEVTNVDLRQETREAVRKLVAGWNKTFDQ